MDPSDVTLRPASGSGDWLKASDILQAVVQCLDGAGRSLWSSGQISVNGLQAVYQLEELRFIVVDGGEVGILFLQRQDPLFWPELTDNHSLFIHKLALHPSAMGKALGRLAVQAVIDEALQRGLQWVRLDCDDRPNLHNFYRSLGFEQVDLKRIEMHRVARYQRALG